MERLLCLKIAARGDLLLAAPAFRALRTSRPGARLTLLVGETCADVGRHLPFFDEVVTLDDQRLMAGNFCEKLILARGLYSLLRKLAPSELFIFHRDWRYGFLAALAGVNVRRGFESPRGTRFLTHPYRPASSEHHVSQYLGMAGILRKEHGQMTEMAGSWVFHGNERENALAKAAEVGFVKAGRWVALGFGGGRNVKTRTALKSWPLDHYRSLASHVTDHGYQVLWIGDGEDAQALTPDCPGLQLAGKLSVTETAAVLSCCQLSVANDTLAMHLSQSLGIPTLGIFGPTDPAHYAPHGARSSFLWHGASLSCSPCHDDGYFPPCLHEHACMRQLSVETVFAKIKELL